MEKKENHINFRLVAATNQDLKEMVSQGKFRLDLFYRLNVIPIQIPALHERKEDIPLLIQHYIQKKPMINTRNSKKIHPSTYEVLTHYHWPGNIRELEKLN
ncbi:sigma 54-interacting transcriptional regulator [Peribacillus frigoritolerans]|nr:sigma 54-interacting transcriptional regulator [Peribacillus frigoritolerans]